MIEPDITAESLRRDRTFAIRIDEQRRNQCFVFLEGAVHDTELEEMRSWLCDTLSERKQWEQVRVVAVKMLVARWKGEEWLRAKFFEILSDRQFEWYYRSVIMSALEDHWARDEEMKSLLLSLFNNRGEDSLVRSGAEARLSAHWGSEESVVSRIREVIADPSESGELQFYALQSVSKYWDKEPWFRPLLESVMLNCNHDGEARGQAAYRLVARFGPVEWLQKNFEDILAKRQKREARVILLRIAGENWGQTSWLSKPVMDMLFDRDNSVEMRCAVVETFSKFWQGDEATREELTKLFRNKRLNKDFRELLGKQLLGIANG